MSEFIPFPQVPHLALLGDVAIRDDKLLTTADRERLLDGPVVVEEKVDGQNLGLSVIDGRLRAQARGDYVELGGRAFGGLAAWLTARGDLIARALGDRYVVYGEWCTDVHSVEYAALPDWFIAFDVFDRQEGGFLASDLRDLFAATIGVAVVPCLGRGVFTLDGLVGLIRESAFGAPVMEGVVVRSEADGLLRMRAKIVRPDFIQSIGEHWTAGERRRNRLALASPPSAGTGPVRP